MSGPSDSEVAVRCDDLTCGYGDVAIVENVDMEIETGEIVALLGGSGSGKSTLLKTLVGLLPPLSGEMEVLGRNIWTLSSEESNDLYQRVGMMYQQGALFGSKTVFENCALPLKEHTDLPEPVIREMVRMKLELVGLKGLEDRLPSDISGGQAKRVALVRASIMEPEIVFADEPSAGLDPIAAAGLDHVLRRFRDLFGMTLVVVTHELESIKILADRVIMLGDGEIRARGTVEELFDSEVDEVRGFFHREPPDFLTTDVGSTLLESLNG